jgi:hypothetical protein
MKEVIRIKVSLSAPGKDEITKLVLKFERESASILMITLLNRIIDAEYCLEDWKGLELFYYTKEEARVIP